MAKKIADTAGARPAKISTDDLYLDAQNPRIDVARDANQSDILKYLWTNSALDELALSITNNGYFPQEPLLVSTTFP